MVEGLAQRPKGHRFDSRDHRLSEILTNSPGHAIFTLGCPCSPDSVYFLNPLLGVLGDEHSASVLVDMYGVTQYSPISVFLVLAFYFHLM